MKIFAYGSGLIVVLVAEIGTYPCVLSCVHRNAVGRLNVRKLVIVFPEPLTHLNYHLPLRKSATH